LQKETNELCKRPRRNRFGGVKNKDITKHNKCGRRRRNSPGCVQGGYQGTDAGSVVRYKKKKRIKRQQRSKN